MFEDCIRLQTEPMEIARNEINQGKLFKQESMICNFIKYISYFCLYYE